MGTPLSATTTAPIFATVMALGLPGWVGGFFFFVSVCWKQGGTKVSNPAKQKNLDSREYHTPSSPVRPFSNLLQTDVEDQPACFSRHVLRCLFRAWGSSSL